MNKKKAYIYSRITPFSSDSILNYQINELLNLSERNNLEVKYISHSIGGNLFDESKLFEQLLSLIKNEMFDVLVIWSPHRITDSFNLYEEFEMYCMKHGVRILTYK